MEIVVYGPGCSRCHQAERVVRRMVEQMGVPAEVRMESDYAAIAAAGVMATPAVGVDGVLRISGRVPTSDEVRAWLTGA
jgi:small redox-active disulfide protein 2